ncbi:MAG: ATP-binding cassette domain-containing protein [Bacteroidaceae bacterium]|nr:ATP-binding cassette domain-containing protein [Bacteroidaceae bacterium]
MAVHLSNSNSDLSLPVREGGGETLLCLSNASIAFGDRYLFRNLNLTVEKGQLIGLAGESGCGKTSLLRAVLGFVPLTEGSIEVCGIPLTSHHVDAIRRLTAYMPQELQPPATTGRDLIDLTLTLSENRTIKKDVNIEPLLAPLGLEPTLLQLSATKLSGGQRQRLLLAAALALPKPLLLLDEPTSALDEDSAQRVALTLLRTCHEQGRAALVVSHASVLLSCCDKVFHL